MRPHMALTEKKPFAVPLSEPLISGNEWRYVKDCLDTGWVSSVGGYVSRFEEMVAYNAGARYAVATSNGTSALHISLVVCGIGPEDEVIVPGITFIAPVNAVRYCGASPVFIDCDMDTLCIDTGKVAGFLENECERFTDGCTYNKRTGKRVKAIVPVHVFGHPADMDPLLELARKHNMAVIEDASESLGSEYKGRKTGSLGTIGCFSFNGNKIVTAGGGGAAVTDDRELSLRIRHLITQAKCDHMEYDHDALGYNYRPTNINAAIGVAQLERLEEFIAIKRENAKMYRELLAGIEQVSFDTEKPWARSNCWFYTIRVGAGHRLPLMRHLLSQGVQVRPVWKPIHKLPIYSRFQAYGTENGTEAYESCLNLPCGVGLNKWEIRYVVTRIADYFKGSEKEAVAP